MTRPSASLNVSSLIFFFFYAVFAYFVKVITFVLLLSEFSNLIYGVIYPKSVLKTKKPERIVDCVLCPRQRKIINWLVSFFNLNQYAYTTILTVINSK